MKSGAEKLKAMTPAPMNSMLEKESRTEAVQKRGDRSKKIVEDVHPTNPGKDHTAILAVLKIRNTMLYGVMFPCSLSLLMRKSSLIQRTENIST